MNSVPNESKPFFFPELDGLRLLAFLLVFVSHIGTPFTSEASIGGRLWSKLVDIGWCGVELFFGISSFIITTLILKEISQLRSFNIKLFYIRRILRIYPLYVLALVTGFIILPFFNWYGLQFGTSAYWDFTWFHLPFFILFTSNFSIGLRPMPMSPMLGPLWSISIEEQFYLLFPWLFKLRKHISIIIVLSLTIFISMPFLRLLMLHLTYQYNYYFTFTRLDSFALGSIVAILMNKFSYIKEKPTVQMLAPISLVVFATLFLWMPSIVDQQFLTIFTYSVASVMCMGLIVSTLWFSPFQKFFSIAFINQWGKITYGCYIYMNFSIWISRQAAGFLKIDNSALNLVFIFSVSLFFNFCIAKCSYIFYEKRFLLMKKYFTRVQSRPVT